MDTGQFAVLRDKVKMTQAEVANRLGVTSRTISAWESANPPKIVTHAEALAIRGLFQSPLLEPRLSEMCTRAASEVYSEIAAIWLVEDADCVLLRGAAHYYESDRPIGKRSRRGIEMGESRLHLVQPSLTTHPLRSAERLNLGGDAITRHPEKRHKKNRATHLAAGGICHSLLHIPAFTPSPKGPHPVLLLSLENKMDEETGSVIERGDGETEPVYTAEDESLAERLAQEFRDELFEDLQLLEMLV